MLNVIREQDNPAFQQAKSLPYDVIALVLQGGGALGAYQAGVYEGLHKGAFGRTGSPAFRSGPSTLQSSPARPNPSAWDGCASFGRPSVPRRWHCRAKG